MGMCFYLTNYNTGFAVKDQGFESSVFMQIQYEVKHIDEPD